MQARLDAQAKQDANVILPRTAPGLEPRTAGIVAAYLNDAERFKNGMQAFARTAAWCRVSISRARWIGVGGSPSVARRCCASG